MEDRFINLFTDYGFKRIFGEEPNKDLLLGFLNDLLPEERITDLTYLKNERLGRNEGERRAVFDLYCTNIRGDRIIVEVQRVKQPCPVGNFSFKDRSVYYASQAIREQAIKGKDWQYELHAVYTIAILDFVFEDTEIDKYEHRVKLLDIATHRVFYDKLTFIYLEIPKFRKELYELKNDFERRLFAFKNLHKLAYRPKELEAGIFKRLFELAEISRMDHQEQAIYEESLKSYRDLKSAMITYFSEGKEEQAEDTAVLMLKNNETIEKIKQYTGLAEKRILELKRSLGL